MASLGEPVIPTSLPLGLGFPPVKGERRKAGAQFLKARGGPLSLTPYVRDLEPQESESPGTEGLAYRLGWTEVVLGPVTCTPRRPSLPPPPPPSTSNATTFGRKAKGAYL